MHMKYRNHLCREPRRGSRQRGLPRAVTEGLSAKRWRRQGRSRLWARGNVLPRAWFCRERGLRQRTVLPTGIFCRAQLSAKRPTSPRAVACRDAGPRQSYHLPTAGVCREPRSANVFFAESPRFCSRQKSRISAKDVFPVVNLHEANIPSKWEVCWWNNYVQMQTWQWQCWFQVCIASTCRLHYKIKLRS